MSLCLYWFCLYPYICTYLLLLELKKNEKTNYFLITQMYLSLWRTNLFLSSTITFHIWEHRYTFSCGLFFLSSGFKLIHLSAKHSLKLFCLYTSTYVKWMRSQNIQNTKNILSHLKQKFQSHIWGNINYKKIYSNLENKMFKCTMLFYSTAKNTFKFISF